jgi:hypothetical protein
MNAILNVARAWFIFSSLRGEEALRVFKVQAFGCYPAGVQSSRFKVQSLGCCVLSALAAG